MRQSARRVEPASHLPDKRRLLRLASHLALRVLQLSVHQWSAATDALSVAALLSILRRRSGGPQRTGQAEVGEDAVVEAGQGADPRSCQREDEQPIAVGNGGVVVSYVQAEGGLSVGPGGDELVAPVLPGRPPTNGSERPAPGRSTRAGSGAW